MTRRTTPSPKEAPLLPLKYMDSVGKLKETDENLQRRPPVVFNRKIDLTFAAQSHHPAKKTTNSIASLTTANLSESACLLAMAYPLERAILNLRR